MVHFKGGKLKEKNDEKERMLILTPDVVIATKGFNKKLPWIDDTIFNVWFQAIDRDLPIKKLCPNPLEERLKIRLLLKYQNPGLQKNFWPIDYIVTMSVVYNKGLDINKKKDLDWFFCHKVIQGLEEINPISLSALAFVLVILFDSNDRVYNVHVSIKDGETERTEIMKAQDLLDQGREIIAEISQDWLKNHKPFNVKEKKPK